MTDVKPQTGEVWQHFKGKRYRVLHIGLHSETQEEVVIYQHEKPERGRRLKWDNRIWVRPLAMWLEKPTVKPLEKGKYNCMHSMQDHFVKDDQMWCQDCIDGAALGRFYLVQEVEDNPGVMEPPSFSDPSILGIKEILKTEKSRKTTP